MGPILNEQSRKTFPRVPPGIFVPRIVIRRTPKAKNRKMDVKIALPRTKEKPVIFLARLGSYFCLDVGSLKIIKATRNATKE
jgi:hypothetical protein